MELFTYTFLLLRISMHFDCLKDCIILSLFWIPWKSFLISQFVTFKPFKDMIWASSLKILLNLESKIERLWISTLLIELIEKSGLRPEVLFKFWIILSLNIKWPFKISLFFISIKDCLSIDKSWKVFLETLISYSIKELRWSEITL